MMRSFRNLTKSWLAKALFIVLLASFAVWGVGPIFSGGRLQVAATVDGTKIAEDEVRARLQSVVRRMEAEYQGAIPAGFIDQNVRPAIVRDMVMDAILSKEAAKLHVVVSDDMVKDTIASEAAFRDDKGQFNAETFKQTLQRAGINERFYISNLKSDLSQSALRGIVMNGAKPPEQLARLLYAYDNEERSAALVYLPLSKFTPPAPTEAELTKYHEENSAKFMAPEYRGYSYVVIDMKKLAEGIKPTADEIAAEYNDHVADYSVPELRTIAMITLKDKETADKIALQASSGTLESVAKINGLKVDSLADVSQTTVLSELANMIFSLPLNKPSEAVQSPLGWHVLAVTKITPASQRSLTEATAEITTRLVNRTLEAKTNDLTKQLEDELAAGATPAEAADRLGLVASTVAATDDSGKTPDGKDADTSAIASEVRKIAFLTESGQTSAVTDSTNSLFAVRVESVTPTQVKPFASVEAEVKKAWQQSKQREAAALAAAEIVQKVKDGAALEKVADEKKLDVVLTPKIMRDTKERGKLTEQAQLLLFSLNKNDAVSTPDTDGQWVLQVRGIAPAKLDGANLQPTLTQLREDLQQNRMDEYASALWNSYGVRLTTQPKQPAEAN